MTIASRAYILTFLFALSASASAGLPMVDQKKVFRIAQGLKNDEVNARYILSADSQQPATIRTIGIIFAPINELWSIVNNCNDYKKNLIRILESNELVGNGDKKADCYMVVDMPFPLSNLKSKTKAVNTVVEGGMHRRVWHMIEGDYQHNNGSWTLYPYGDLGQETLVVYDVQVVPNYFLPDVIIRAFQKSAMPKLFDKLRKRLVEIKDQNVPE